MLGANNIGLEEFRRWNPFVNAACGNLVVGKSYCIETTDEQAPAPAPAPASSSASSARSSAMHTPSTFTTSPKPVVTSSASKSTPPSTTTTTSVENGMETPQLTQAGMVSNCARFHYIGPNTNPSVNADYTGLRKLVHFCVAVIGGGVTTTIHKPSSITPGNGVQRPPPTQPGMVRNCNKFHFINQGVVCTQNPTIRDNYSGMWANVNVCVGVIRGGSSPTPTTSAGNSIQTPQPTQPSITTKCKKFHHTVEGVVCSQLTSYNKISLADFVKWNPGVRSDCRTMWANTYFCVSV